MAASVTPGASGRSLQIEIQPLWKGRPFVLGKELVSSSVPGLSFSRVDALLSGLALQRTDGSWMPSADWFVHLSAGKAKWVAVADGVPAETFKAVRFQVGLTEAADASDPNLRAVDHPLHPDVCGLHWGWQSGYVFCALEGHFRSPKGELSGFSYHLAGSAQPMWIEIPVELKSVGPMTLRLGWDLADVVNSGGTMLVTQATHSRPGDPAADPLKRRMPHSFRLKSVHSDIFQITALPVAKDRVVPPEGTTPFSLSVSQRLPKATTPADNPLTVEGVELGRLLFHEVRLSKNGQQSCASCHQRGKSFTEELPVSLGTEGQRGRRNAMALFNLAWSKEFFWDGRARSLREQVLLPIQDRHEMNESLDRVTAKFRVDPKYPAQFQRAFGREGIDPERIALALEQFLLTLVSQNSKFDRAARGILTLSPQEKRGLELFTTEHDPARGLRGADCFHCHGGNLFTSQDFLNNGLRQGDADLGRFEVTKKDSDRYRFKVPTLRNVGLTAPYMHDGRFATLQEVVDHYNGPMERTSTLDPNLAKHPASGLGLATEDKEALVAFLLTLTDEDFTGSVALEAPASTRSTSEPSAARTHVSLPIHLPP